MTRIPAFSDNARKVIEQRYLQRNSSGKFIETPHQLFQRVAKLIASAEMKWQDKKAAKFWEKEFYNLMTSLEFLPNSPTLMNAGTRCGQLSACFVLPLQDSLFSIFETLKNTALIQQSGGGTGFNFSSLRPQGDYINKTGGEASGPVSFMRVFDAATQYIKQGGRRRGANMAILNADHPDIENFISVKSARDSLNNFNISVGVPDTFMKAVERNDIWVLRHPATRKSVSEVKALSLWKKIIKCAHETGDPGLIFLDEINRHNPTPALGRITATNPCGEVPLLDFEACNLGSVNLSRMLTKTEGKTKVDWDKLKATVHSAIRFLDNTIEVNDYILPEIKEVVCGNRKIGLGVMGWAEMLIELGIPYDTDEAVELGGKLMKFIGEQSSFASVSLASERGNFKNWNQSVYAGKSPMRNATRTCIAPTGTISILAGTSSSIEPLFAPVFERRNVLNGAVLPEINRLFASYLKPFTKGQLLKQETPEQIMKLMMKLSEETRRLFRTAHEISWNYHLRHQVAFQEYTDNAVSKTINLPESANEKDIENTFRNAWKMKAKGITVYRYNSKSKQVMNLDSDLSIPTLLHGGTESCRVCAV